LAKLWRDYGFDEVELPEYKVMLSFPQPDKPNIVELLEDGKIVHQVIGKINVSI